MASPNFALHGQGPVYHCFLNYAVYYTYNSHSCSQPDESPHQYSKLQIAEY